MDNPLENVFAFAEQAYVQRQAENVLALCLEQRSLAPVHMLVEDLVLAAGPQSVMALNEILNEAEGYRSRSLDDLQRLFLSLQSDLSERGVRLSALASDPLSLLDGALPAFQERLAGMDDVEPVLASIAETKQAMQEVVSRLELLRELTTYVEDWLWGMARQWIQTLPPAFPGGSAPGGEYVQ